MKKHTVMGLAILAVALGAGCDGIEPLGPGSETFDIATALTPGTISAGQVTVCKDAPEGGYEFTIVANTSNVTVPTNGRFALQAGDCAGVAVAHSKRQSVTVNEMATRPGIVFDHVDVYRFTATSSGKSGTPVFVGRVNTRQVTVQPIGPDNGWILVYVNVRATG